MNAPFTPSRRDLLLGTGSLVVAFSLTGSRVVAIAQELAAGKSVALDQAALVAQGAQRAFTRR